MPARCQASPRLLVHDGGHPAELCRPVDLADGKIVLAFVDHG
jgi:hypothetical protein